MKLGTYLVLERIWNPIDFQGHRVKLLGEGIRTPRFVLPLLIVKLSKSFVSMILEHFLMAPFVFNNATFYKFFFIIVLMCQIDFVHYNELTEYSACFITV